MVVVIIVSVVRGSFDEVLDLSSGRFVVDVEVVEVVGDNIIIGVDGVGGIVVVV